VYFNDVLHLDDLPIAARAVRAERRKAWLARALTATSGCDVVFVDPDQLGAVRVFRQADRS